MGNNTNNNIMLTFIYSLDKITLNISLCIIFWVITYLREIYTLYYYSNDIEESKELYIESVVKYLDKYYITNIFYTIFAVVVYFAGNISVVIYLRYFLNTNKKNIPGIYPIDIEYIQSDNSVYIMLIINILILMITIISYKKMLDALFFTEVIKLHLYLNKNHYYFFWIRQRIDTNYYYELFEKLFLFLYNVTQLREKSKEITTNFEDFYNFYEHNDIYEKPHIMKMSIFLVNLAKKYRYFHSGMLIILKMVKMIFYTFIQRKLARYIPNIIYFVIVFYDFIHLHFYYSYYTFSIFYTITLILSCLTFWETKSYSKDLHIYEYFYNNDKEYKNQRLIFNSKTNIYIDILNISKQNHNLFHGYKSGDDMLILKNYISNDFVEKLNKNLDLEAKGKAMINRYYILILLSIPIIHLAVNLEKYQLVLTGFNFNMSITYIIILFYLLIIYCAFNIFKSSSDDVEDYLQDYKYSKCYNIIYWILMPLLLWLLYITIIKGTLFVITDGVLWECNGIKIIRI